MSADKDTQQDERIKTLFVHVGNLTERIKDIEDRLDDLIIVKEKMLIVEQNEKEIYQLDKSFALLVETFKHMQEQGKEQSRIITQHSESLQSLIHKQTLIDEKMNHRLDDLNGSIQGLKKSVDGRLINLESGDSKFIHDSRDGMKRNNEKMLDFIQKYGGVVGIGALILIKIIESI